MSRTVPGSRYAASAAVVGTRRKAARGVSLDFMDQEKVAYTSALDGDMDAVDNITTGDSIHVTDSSTADSK